MATSRQHHSTTYFEMMTKSNEMGPDYDLSMRSHHPRRYQMMLHVDGQRYPISAEMTEPEMTRWVNAFTAPSEIIQVSSPEQIDPEDGNLVNIIAYENLVYHGFYICKSQDQPVLYVVVD